MKLPASARRTAGSKPQQRRGLLLQRGAVSRSTAKLKAKQGATSLSGMLSRRSQKGAVTRAQKALAAAKQGGRVRMKGAGGVIRPGKPQKGLGMSRVRPGQVKRALARAVANEKRLEWRASLGAASTGSRKPEVGYSVAKGAQDYYTGKLSRKQKATFAPLTRSQKPRGKASAAAKPKGLKPEGLAAKQQKPAAPKRTAEEQARRDLIARGLKKLPKEKRARAIAMRREMEGRVTAPGQPKPRMTQKERWLNRANVYERAAQRNMERVAQIERKHASYRGDIAFNTQPGRIPARERMIREQERGFELRKKAQAQLLRAQELRKLATTNKGDAERKRQAQRDAVTIEKGARMSTRLYGPGRVVRVNKKTVSYYSERTGSIINVDKSWVMTS